MGRALLIVDMQEMLIPLTWRGEELADRVAALAASARGRDVLSHGLDVVLVSDGHAPAAGGDPAAGPTPEQIVDHHNTALSRAIHPGGRLRLVAARRRVLRSMRNPQNSDCSRVELRL